MSPDTLEQRIREALPSPAKVNCVSAGAYRFRVAPDIARALEAAIRAHRDGDEWPELDQFTRDAFIAALSEDV